MVVFTIFRGTSRNLVAPTTGRDDMSVVSRLWREASLAVELEGFLERTGATLLQDLDANVVIVRVLDRNHLATVGCVRRGAVGVNHPAKPRSELSAAALARITAWLEAGGAEDGASSVGRDVVRGVAESEDVWTMVPLVAGSDATGVLLVGGAEAIEARKLTAIGEPIAAVLAAERARRELT